VDEYIKKIAERMNHSKTGEDRIDAHSNNLLLCFALFPLSIYICCYNVNFA
jgi:hypothetical protein